MQQSNRYLVLLVHASHSRLTSFHASDVTLLEGQASFGLPTSGYSVDYRQNRCTPRLSLFPAWTAAQTCKTARMQNVERVGSILAGGFFLCLTHLVWL